MKRFLFAMLTVVSAIVIALVPAGHDAHAAKPPTQSFQYTLVDLANQEGELHAINQLTSGVVEVVGRLLGPADEPHYWMLNSAGAILSSASLQTLEPTENSAIDTSLASDINQHGVIVGYQTEVAGDQRTARPLLWPVGGAVPVELPLPVGSGNGAFATSINDDGIVVGAAENGLVAWKVSVNAGNVAVSDCTMIWSNSTGSPVGIWSQIANSGHVCVTVSSDTERHAFRLRLQWNAGTQQLEVADSAVPLFPEALYSSTHGVNEAGTVCGEVNLGSGVAAFALTLSGQSLNLPGLPAVRQDGFDYGATHNVRAMAINNTTPLQVVGDAARSIFKRGKFYNSEMFPVRWDVDTQVTRLESVTAGTPDLTGVAAINDAGWIAATRRDDVLGTSNRPVVLIRKP